MDPGIKIRHSDPSIESNTKIIRQIEQIFEPNCMLFKELKEKKMQLPSQCFYKEDKNTKKYDNIVRGEGGKAVNYSRIFAFRGDF